MKNISVSDKVITNRVIQAGRCEDGPIICAAGTRGVVDSIEHNEWDGVHVKLEIGVTWWFKPSQLDSDC